MEVVYRSCVSRHGVVGMLWGYCGRVYILLCTCVHVCAFVWLNGNVCDRHILFLCFSLALTAVVHGNETAHKLEDNIFRFFCEIFSAHSSKEIRYLLRLLHLKLCYYFFILCSIGNIHFVQLQRFFSCRPLP